MSPISKRRFEVNPTEYELFRFTVPRSAILNVRLLATEPVNVLLLDQHDLENYKSGNHRHSYSKAWGRRTDLDDEIEVEPGTWYITIEGREQPSTGRLEVYH
jgi:hypothetical protein